jgi:hypothetical protein
LESGVFVGCENTEMTFFFSFYEFHDWKSMPDCLSNRGTDPGVGGFLFLSYRHTGTRQDLWASVFLTLFPFNLKENRILLFAGWLWGTCASLEKGKQREIKFDPQIPLRYKITFCFPKKAKDFSFLRDMKSNVNSIQCR